MNLNVYDIAAHLIAGFVIYLAGLHLFDLQTDYLDPVIATAVAYVLGYFVNAIGAWIETALFWYGEALRRLNF